MPNRDQPPLDGRHPRRGEGTVGDGPDGLASLHEEHHERPFTVAVVYGAGHMPAVVEHLRGRFRYFLKEAEWLTVVNAPG